MRSVIWLAAVFGCGPAGSTSDRPNPPPEAPRCIEAGTTEVLAPLVLEELTEVSGVVASRVHPDVVWVHNDSGDTARVFAVRTDGAPLAEFSLQGVPAGDFEDLALAPDGDGWALYLGDIGDNGMQRSSVVVYRFAEPALDVAVGSVEAEALELTYPDGPFDAETLLVDPRSGDLYIVTKDWEGPAHVYRKPAPHTAGSTVLELVASLDFGLAPLSGWATTGGDVSPDGAFVAIRTYQPTVFAWPLGTQELGAAMLEEPCIVESVLVPQAEALGFEADGSGLFTVGEGRYPPLYRTALREVAP